MKFGLCEGVQGLEYANVLHGGRVGLSFLVLSDICGISLDYPALIVPVYKSADKDAGAILYRRVPADEGTGLAMSDTFQLDPQRPLRLMPGSYALMSSNRGVQLRFLLISLPCAGPSFPQVDLPALCPTECNGLSVMGLNEWCGIPNGAGVEISIQRLQPRSSTELHCHLTGAETVIPLFGGVRLKGDGGEEKFLSESFFLDAATVASGVPHQACSAPDQCRPSLFLSIKTADAGDFVIC